MGVYAGASVIAALVALAIILVVVFAAKAKKDNYSVGYQIGPHYLGTSAWEGTPYVLSQNEKESFKPFAAPDDGPRDSPELIYKPPFTRDLRGDHPNWWRPDNGTYGLPPAAARPNFWNGDATIHTYLAKDSIPQLCDPEEVVNGQRRLTPEEWTKKWRYYGGPKGWNMSPYY